MNLLGEKAHAFALVRALEDAERHCPECMSTELDGTDGIGYECDNCGEVFAHTDAVVRVGELIGEQRSWEHDEEAPA